MCCGQDAEFIFCTPNPHHLLFLPRLEIIPHKVSPKKTSGLWSSDERGNFVWSNNLSHTKYHPLSDDCIMLPNLFDQAYMCIEGVYRGPRLSAFLGERKKKNKNCRWGGLPSCFLLFTCSRSSSSQCAPPRTAVSLALS